MTSSSAVKIGILISTLLIIGVSCKSTTIDSSKASEAVKQAFSLTGQDKIEISGIADDIKSTKLVKFSVNGKQATGKIRKYDRGWQLDEIQDELGTWLPVSRILKQFGDSAHILLDAKVSKLWDLVQPVFQRRADLVPKLVEAATEVSKLEEPAFTTVINARAKVNQAGMTDSRNIEAFAKFQKAQDDLSLALASFLARIEKYPNVKGNNIFRELRSQLEVTENQLTVERMRYNQAATEYNINISGTMVFLLGSRFSEVPIFKPSGSVPPPPVRF